MRPKTPINGRLFALVPLIALVAFPAIVIAQEAAWTADDAVSRALANPDVEGIVDGRVRGARAELEVATLVPAPTLSVSHEQVFGDEQIDDLESTVTLQQQFDLSGWRERLRQTLPHREAALRAEADQWRHDVATSVRTAFFEVRYREERMRALDAWCDRLEGGVTASKARQERGDTALYDVRRVERELETGRAQRAREEALVAEAWAALRMWSPWRSRPALSGELTPSVRPPKSATVLPRLVRLQSLEQALGAEAKAWGSPMWREWIVGAGYRFTEVGSTNGHGLIVSLSVPLALWNNDRPKIERLRAERARIGSELRLGRTLAEQAETAARERRDRALASLSSLSAQPGDAELTRLAEAAYGAGEATLTELLDAYESETELELSRIDLQWEARRAAIELDRRRGIGVPR